MCCVISCVIKGVLGVVAGVLMTIGIILMVIGALLLWGFSSIVKMVYSLEQQISSILKSLGVNSSSQEVINLVANNASVLGSIALAIGVVMIAFSIVIIVAMCCCSGRMILIVVVILLCALTLGLIVLVLVYGTNPTNQILTPIQTFIQTNIILKYVGIQATNAESVMVNVIQIGMKCCGLNNYTDFNNALDFNRTLLLSNGTTIMMTFPISCCHYNDDFIISPANDLNCKNNQVSDRMNIGCWSLVGPKLRTVLSYCFTTLGITIGVLLAAIVALLVVIFCLEKIP